MQSDSASTISRMVQAPQKLARSTGSNFYYAFLLLPRAQREGIKNVYGFCRIIDDIVDEDPTGRDPAAELEHWREEIEACFAGRPATDFGERLTNTIDQFNLPKQPFHDLIDGMEMDLKWQRYQTFADLREYCYRAASAVGLLCIEIFGYESIRTREYAVNMGLALQLTNILRDLKEDVERDRIYIPIEDLERFGYSEQDLKASLYNSPFIDMMRFEHARALSYFDRAEEALTEEDRRSMFAAETMGAIYRELLDGIAAGQFDVYRNIPKLSKGRRLRIALGIWARGRFGRSKKSKRP